LLIEPEPLGPAARHVPVNLDTRRKALPALFEYLSVVERIVDYIAIFVGQIVIFPKWRGRPLAAVWFQVRSDFLVLVSG
jgi:hypothetical protein